MALYLDEQTRPYLERLVKQIKETDFIGKRLQKMLIADRERLDVMGKCDHHAATYTGKKTCCSSCESFYEPGMSIEWMQDQLAGDQTEGDTGSRTTSHEKTLTDDGQNS